MQELGVKGEWSKVKPRPEVPHLPCLLWSISTIEHDLWRERNENFSYERALFGVGGGSDSLWWVLKMDQMVISQRSPPVAYPVVLPSEREEADWHCSGCSIPTPTAVHKYLFLLGLGQKDDWLLVIKDFTEFFQIFFLLLFNESSSLWILHMPAFLTWECIMALHLFTSYQQIWSK